jgi:hypothetical protein
MKNIVQFLILAIRANLVVEPLQYSDNKIYSFQSEVCFIQMEDCTVHMTRQDIGHLLVSQILSSMLVLSILKAMMIVEPLLCFFVVLKICKITLYFPPFPFR